LNRETLDRISGLVRDQPQQGVIGLYKLYLESYWPAHQADYDRITKAGGMFCGTFGPEAATVGYSEFLGYFMPRKVMCGKEMTQAAGTVTKKLGKLLEEKGYIQDSKRKEERARRARTCQTPEKCWT
jgi:hypothetical protein